MAWYVLSRRSLRFAAAFSVAGLLFAATGASAQTNLVTPVQYLATLPKPQFAPRNNLPHLSESGWPLPSDVMCALATNWGYAISLSDATTNVVAAMSNTNSTVSQLIQFAKNYQLAVQVNVWRTSDVFTNPPAGYYCTNSAGLFVDQTGTNFFTSNQFTKVVSPEAPDAYLASISEYEASCIRAINSNVPVKIILNPGEYGLSVVGSDNKAWRQDPRVQQQDVMTNMYSTNIATGTSWCRYDSRQKSHQLSFLTSRINQYIPNRELYVFYSTGDEQSRFVAGGYGSWEESWSNWGWWSEYMNSNTDLPSFEDYYKAPNSWTNASGTTLFNVTDLLTKHLDAVGYGFRIGQTNSYNWLNGGYSTSNTNAFCSIPRYMGFIKCLYTAGQVGGIALCGLPPQWYQPNNGWILGTNGFVGSFPPDQPPHWIQQLVVLSRVHAEFSHLTNWMYGSQLISGPQHHFMSTDQPAYEFTNNAADPNIRVLARKMYNTNEWLVCAWAADGTDRNATVTIPVLGTVQVLARDCGSVYIGTTTNLTLVDTNGLFPTERTSLAPASSLRIMGGSAH